MEYGYSRGSRACNIGSAVHFIHHANPSISTKKVNTWLTCIIIYCSNLYLMMSFPTHMGIKSDGFCLMYFSHLRQTGLCVAHCIYVISFLVAQCDKNLVLLSRMLFDMFWSKLMMLGQPCVSLFEPVDHHD